MISVTFLQGPMTLHISACASQTHRDYCLQCFPSLLVFVTELDQDFYALFSTLFVVNVSDYSH